MACGACAQKNKKVTYIWTGSDGSKKVFSSEIEAKAQKARRGGTYQQQ